MYKQAHGGCACAGFLRAGSSTEELGLRILLVQAEAQPLAVNVVAPCVAVVRVGAMVGGVEKCQVSFVLQR